MLSFKQTALASVFAMAAFSLSNAPASATVYDWTFSDAASMISGSGQLTTADVLDGIGYDITAISGTIGNELVTGLIGGNPGYSTGNGQAPSVITADGGFYYDNILYPAANSDVAALLDNSGLLLATAGHAEANIYGVGSNGYGYTSSISGGTSYDINDGSGASFSIAAVPEPASMALIGSGLFGLAVIRRRRARALRTGV